jgi:hypothetical protein
VCFVGPVTLECPVALRSFEIEPHHCQCPVPRTAYAWPLDGTDAIRTPYDALVISGGRITTIGAVMRP